MSERDDMKAQLDSALQDIARLQAENEKLKGHVADCAFIHEEDWKEIIAMRGKLAEAQEAAKRGSAAFDSHSDFLRQRLAQSEAAAGAMRDVLSKCLDIVEANSAFPDWINNYDNDKLRRLISKAFGCTLISTSGQQIVEEMRRKDEDLSQRKELLMACREAIDTAIYAEDGLDGADGERLIKQIDQALSPTKAGES